MRSVQPLVDRFEQGTRVRAVVDLLGSGCVAFYPRLADLTGSVTAALLLGQCLYWTDRVLRQQAEREGWFWKTAVEWRQEIGLTRRKQETARCTVAGAGTAGGETRRDAGQALVSHRCRSAGTATGPGAGGDRLWPALDRGRLGAGATPGSAPGLLAPAAGSERERDGRAVPVAGAVLAAPGAAAMEAPAGVDPSSDLPEPADPAFRSPATGARACPLAPAGVPRGAAGTGRALAANDAPRSALAFARGAGGRRVGAAAPKRRRHRGKANARTRAAVAPPRHCHWAPSRPPQDPPNSNGQMRQPWLALPCDARKKETTTKNNPYPLGHRNRPPLQTWCRADRGKSGGGGWEFPNFILPTERPTAGAAIVRYCPA